MNSVTRGRLAIAWIVMLGSAALAQQVMPPAGSPLDEPYRKEFATCDRQNIFHGLVQRPPHTCKSDPSRFTRFDRIPPAIGRPEAIVYVAKLAWDRDGSPFACSTPGHTDQCATSYMLNPTVSVPCPQVAGTRPPCVPIDADRVPYVAIPAAGPASSKPREFREKTGIGWGDFGVVIANGKAVPVIVADGGPANKIGEGSTALLQALSADGKARTIGSGVTFVLFPRSAEKLTVVGIEQRVRTGGAALYQRLIGAAQ